MKKNLATVDIINATKGELLSELKKEFEGVGTDTRKPLHGQLFIALKGDTFDAHDYLDQAVNAGASGLIIHRLDPKFDNLKTAVTIIQVSDTLQALQDLGRFRRREANIPIIGITGSNGKTTTKEFTAQLIGPYRQVHYNQGSFNNHWGLPLTLLGIQPDHQVAICEMGMNHPGEINSLVAIAEPNIVGVTMVGRAHLEGLGTIEAVAEAKAEIYNGPNPNYSIGIFNLDNPWTLKMYQQQKATGNRTLTFSSIDSNADVFLQIDSMNFDHLQVSGSISGKPGKVKIEVFGKQNLTNLMFAACAGLAVGLSPQEIWQSLPNCKTTWGRNQKLHHPSGADILFDGYNANPDSQKALLENLKLLQKTRPLIGIFGEMRELGDHSPELHTELGLKCAEVNFDQVIFVGKYGKEFETGFKQNSGKGTLFTFNDVVPELVDQIKHQLNAQPIITIKGSRGVKLERILKDLALI